MKYQNYAKTMKDERHLNSKTTKHNANIQNFIFLPEIHFSSGMSGLNLSLNMSSNW